MNLVCVCVCVCVCVFVCWYIVIFMFVELSLFDSYKFSKILWSGKNRKREIDDLYGHQQVNLGNDAHA